MRGAPLGTALGGRVEQPGGPTHRNNGSGSELAVGVNGYQSLVEAMTPRSAMLPLESKLLPPVPMLFLWLGRVGGAVGARSGDP